MKNQNWEQEEVILLVDTYYNLKNSCASKEDISKEIQELSKLLRQRANILGYDVNESYRNYTGINMKYYNIQYIDTNGEHGLSGASSFDREVVSQYMSTPEYIQLQAQNIRNNYSLLTTDECPLVSELKRLKKSSYEAVDNEKSFSEFKRYMHIHRSLEDELIQKIEQANNSKKKSLILVCGNVGDGKSHIISYLKNNHNDVLKDFTIHNDATESMSRNRNEKEELSRVLNNFSDENLDNDSNDKIIVAINLGVLSNFIDSEQGRRFGKLSEYVNKNRILIDTDVVDCSDDSEYFYHVNFGDYHIYRLNEGKVDSPYIKETIDKIFAESEKNPFYVQYQKCSKCTLNKQCPVKCNYEMLQSKKSIDGLINILIETIIKDKIILSTRDLLNFFYDIIVHPQFVKKDYEKKKDNFSVFLDYCMPNLLYGHTEISSLLTHIKKYDFVSQRTEKFDEITTRFNTTNNLTELFDNYISDNSVKRFILSNNINDICNVSAANGKKTREKLLYCFIRLCKISPKDNSLTVVNKEFNDFISDLFYSIQKNKKELRKLYSMVINCVYAWNGSYNKKRINLKNDIDGYTVSAKLDLEPDLNEFNNQSFDTTFEKFPSYINLTLSKKSEPRCKASVSIDYDLYKMMKLVEQGYRPSAKDNNRFISFLSFINTLSGFSSLDEEVTIQHSDNYTTKEYILNKDGFGYSFREVK